MRITLKLKLAATLTVLIALAVIGLFTGLNSLHSMNEDLNHIVAQDVERVRLPLDLDATQIRIQREIRELLLADTPATRQTVRERLAERRKQAQESYRALFEVASDEGKALLESFSVDWLALVELNNRAVSLAEAGNAQQGYRMISGDGRAIWLRMESVPEELKSTNLQRLRDETVRTDEAYLSRAILRSPPSP
jgi:methyl-accepting chemotaxis protein